MDFWEFLQKGAKHHKPAMLVIFACLSGSRFQEPRNARAEKNGTVSPGTCAKECAAALSARGHNSRTHFPMQAPPHQEVRPA
ncbi:hypothetical protein [Parvibacter caecicola]|uniref:Uncharacterized protein n=1 Tax=Parvibacter caecicola TaxID=747645 RepID=A0A4T9T8Y2_9ACTN|nr:hypothetical protein [Parvibacter caecicola]TJW11311.1 hypothetical protein E5982_03635 [Parvibacter caecicola]